MLDFMKISTRSTPRGGLEVYPKFIINNKSEDLMIRGGDFYAIWDEERGLWSTDEDDVIRLVDREVKKFADEKYQGVDSNIKKLYMWDAESGMIDRWHKYCQKQLRDNYHMLDENLIFSNTDLKKSDYASKKLNYALEKGDISGWDKLISTLYSEEERAKIEWAIGAIVSGDSKEIQKFMVLYGESGAGKSTILNIIQKLFDGYYGVFDAKALGSANSQFALEAFRKNPLVAIQHDGDLSRIEDNTRLNSVVSHELMTVNEKHKSVYEGQFKCFLFMGTNKPVKITDAKSGIIRRLIDVTPSGKKLPAKEYKRVNNQINFELGAIAKHCLDVYLSDPGKYDDYIPIEMMGASNDFYNFIVDSYPVFKQEDGITLKSAWEMYKAYCDEAKVPYPLPKRTFTEELKNYFYVFNDRFNKDDGSRVRSYYSGFRVDRIMGTTEQKTPEPVELDLLRLEDYISGDKNVFDEYCASCPAQYSSTYDGKEQPSRAWSKIKTTVTDIDSTKLHYVKVPLNHIVIDFDIPDENGNKCYEKNLEAASKWPPTYAEVSKSGAGIHLHYIYVGDPETLSRVYDDHIEVKVFTGKSSLRRKLTKCNNLPIASINSGLPLKGEKKMINFEGVKNEKAIRTSIKRNLNKEIHSSTKCSIDFIYKILEDAYNDGVNYDVSDMKNSIVAFAAGATNQSDYCIKLVSKMKFKSEDTSEAVTDPNADLVFYDVEVFPNLFLVNWKSAGEGKPVTRMINPKPSDIETLMRFRLVGFNCRRYDNHLLYARLMGYTNEQLFNLSQKIVSGDRNAFFGEAYNVSYTDVYDFSNTKQSLKKWEIQLGLHHQELGLPWDQPVPENLWTKVAEYCDNDVIATEAVFNYLKADWTARQILADLAGASVNDSTNTLTAKIIFGNDRKPQSQFNYRNMGDESAICKHDLKLGEFDEYTAFDKQGRPIFPGYKYEYGKSTYRDEEAGEGGFVYAEPGMHVNVALLDVESMHPASIEAEELFGPVYTPKFVELRQARLACKHENYDILRTCLGGKLAKYLTGEYTLDDLSYALKIPINMVYGQTAAKYDNAFRDIRNVDNIVAKRGALFMINLKYEVQKRGFTVAHIKTDSIKIPNANKDIINFVSEYGKLYGYTFEHEATYEKMCLVNDAVYIARYSSPDHCEKSYGYIPKKNKKNPLEWTATGAQFAVPYVFKKLFSKESIVFADMCETKSVTSALYLRNCDPNGSRTIIDPQTGYETEMKNTDTPEFIGRVGLFCPIKPGCGGGELLRESKDSEGNIKYDAANGTKGYFWLESEVVKALGKENDIDRSYYDKLVDTAVETISKYGDFEWFVNDTPLDAELINELNKQTEPEHVRMADVNFECLIPSECMKYKSNCSVCPHYEEKDNKCDLGYSTIPF